MALSGSVATGSWTSSGGQTRNYTLSWSSSPDIANNRSTITWWIDATGSYPYNVAERTLYAVIAGNVVVNKTDRVMRGPGRVSSGSFVVYHATDGTFGFTVSIQAAVYTSAVNCVGSGTFSLDQIPRAASITSAPNFNDEQNPVLGYSNPAGSAVSSLQACISLTGSAADVPYRNIPVSGKSYTFSLTEAERNTLRLATTSGSNSRKVVFIVKTVIGGNTFYSRAERVFTVANAAPSLSAAVEDSNQSTIALTGNKNVFVKFQSNAAVSMSVTAKKGATITGRRISCGGKSVSAASGTLTAVESGSFVFTATDNRGNTVTQTLNKTLINYVKLTCNLQASAPNAEGEMTFQVEGNCFNGSFGVSSNSVQVSYRYREDNGSYGDWTEADAVMSGNTYSAEVSLTGLDYTKQYTFQARAVDLLMTTDSAEKTVKTTPVFDWGKEDFCFNVQVTVKGALKAQGAVSAGAASTFPAIFMGSSGAYLYTDGNGNFAIRTKNSATGATYKYYTFSNSGLNLLGNSLTAGKVTVTGIDSSNAMSDYIVARGTSGSWRYWKWASGLAICIHNSINNGNFANAAWGTLYSNRNMTFSAYPFTFAETPAVYASRTNTDSGYEGQQVMFVMSGGSRTNPPVFDMARATTSTIGHPYVSIVAIGRWK